MSVLSRWEARLRIREALLETARRQYVYWYRRWRQSVEWNLSDKERSRRYQLMLDRRAKVALREEQVAYARRVVARHSDGREVSAAGVALIAGFEGFRSCPYRDAVGVWTIGYGHTHGVGPNTKCLSKAQAEKLLHKTVDEFAAGVRSRVRKDTTQAEFSAMVSFAYNVGLGAFAGSTLLRKHNAGDRSGAANEFLKWDKAGGRRLLGLTRRRRAERAMYLS